MNFTTFSRRALAALAVVSLAAACGDDNESSTAATQAPATTPMTEPTTPMTEPMDTAPMDTMAEEVPMDSTEACDADAIVAMVEGGPADGTLAGMTTDPVGTAASNNPVLTTLTAAVTAAGLVDTLNEAPALTVFAPTDCAFAALDPATLEGALADPTGLLTEVLGFHVVPERFSMDDLEGVTELPTFTGGTLPIEKMGDTVTVGGQAMVIVGDIQTANATVFLIDTVMLPPMEG